MFELLIAGISIFGGGSWNCTHEYEYPQQSVRETFVSNIQYAEDFSYVASNKIIYSHLDDEEVFAQFSYEEEGVAKVQGNQFYLDGRAFNVVKDFDKIGHFKDGYTNKVTEFLNAPLSSEEKTLTVISRSSTNMVVEHEQSGTITQCWALKSES
ncbi:MULTISPECIES: hypothetical protein [Halomonadaceae]|uniref:hypothetical protein n=1 Tax=Halomonadaceae TaxID=28256 RepID=UPI0012F34645|nr:MULTISPECIES: hypothetical protein [Halomonas]CAD5248464.1 hypothetical protein HALO59_100249 [Halomonas sp. 59]CAD5248571.1 hypothetical protein HALO113_100270 [Halomonas sp. 113]CAD5251796.1 hypothetical protein HALO156_110032 [Halomonas sp. 156]CAD5257011.1 hypothetical protein HALOI3_140112 [Halomonas sp. I3]VXC00722.1 hypothetical protein HALO153_230143 [Halomonas titanicae]